MYYNTPIVGYTWRAYASGFEGVTADVTVSDATSGGALGGVDKAYLYHDPSSNDLFFGTGDEASFDYRTDGIVEMLVRGFGIVHAISDGGSDQRTWT